ncbi:MAG: acetylornithine deacetylase, partial [Allobranchiibius sp.]
MSAHPQAVAKLQTLVRIPTVSNLDPALVDTAAFDLLLTELARLFPLLHEHLDLTRVATHGLLFHWAGRSPHAGV